MGTKNNPSEFDCFKNAEPDEPMFILLGRDPGAALIVRLWALHRANMVRKGEKPAADLAMIDEAFECADAMEGFAEEWAARKAKPQ